MVKAAGRMHGSFEERMLNNLEKSTKKKRSGGKLTRQQVIRALKRLERGWPEDLWIFAADSQLHLMEKKDGSHAMTDKESHWGEGVDRVFIVDSFDGIDASGGDW